MGAGQTARRDPVAKPVLARTTARWRGFCACSNFRKILSWTARVAIEPTQCQNCTAPLAGGYCSQCGQSTATLDLPVGDFAKEFVTEAFSLDSRVRHTLKPLFLSPGSVPEAYVAGHRARFVPPVRLYIFASFIMFLLLNLGGGVTVSDVEVSNSGSTAVDSPSAESVSSSEAGENSGERSWPDRFADRLTRGLQRLAESPQSFGGDILNRLAQAMFFLLPAVALLLKLVHRRRLYVHHLVFAVYLHSFAFLVVALVAVPDAVGLTEPGRFMAIALLGIPPYALLAMKRFYGESWWKTVAKFSFVSLAYSLLGIATAGAVLLLTVLSA